MKAEDNTHDDNGSGMTTPKPREARRFDLERAIPSAPMRMARTWPSHRDKARRSRRKR